MPILSGIRERFEKEKPLKGVRISVALHLEKKTGILLETLQAGGAEIAASSCNPLTTDDSVAAALSKKMEIFAWSGQSKEEYYGCLNAVLEQKPQIVIDDGCDLINLLHGKRQELLPQIIGACEETTTGVIRLKAMQSAGKLKFPVMSVNDAYSKHLFDNRYGTGQSTLDAIMRITNKLIAGKTAVVLGYGWCGRGIASRLRGMGASVIVCEIGSRLGESGIGTEDGACKPASAQQKRESGCHRALEALYDGFRVMGIDEAASLGDIFITATGNKNAIDVSHIEKMKNGAIVCNAGHFNNEIDIEGITKKGARKEVLKENLECFTLKNGKCIYLLSEGRLVNLARPSGQGHPIEIMDGSFAVQALSAEYLVKNKGKLKAGVISVPCGIDDEVARLALFSQGIILPKPTKEQIEYSTAWEHGT